MAVFCTISTNSHLFKSFALADSLAKFGGELLILVVDNLNQSLIKEKPKNVQIFSLQEIQSELSKKIIKKYKSDKLRWALKPIFLIHVLQQYEKVIYVDNDIYFFNDFQFLMQELDNNDILLSPHFYPSSPKENQTWLEANYRLGLYNAGFIGANKNAIPALEWWAECCLYAITKSSWRGLFDDQKYLDLLPVKFDKVQILKHRGCNLAAWNDDIQLKKEDIIFIHFNSFTLIKFCYYESFYKPFLEIYIKKLHHYKPDYKLKSNRFSLFKIKNAIYYIRWKTIQHFNNLVS